LRKFAVRGVHAAVRCNDDSRRLVAYEESDCPCDTQQDYADSHHFLVRQNDVETGYGITDRT